MPNKKSAEKALRKSKKRAARNKAVKDSIAYMLKQIRKGIEAEEKKAVEEWMPKALKAIDKAAGKGILKKNTAARKKSRLTKRVNTFLKTS